MSYKVAFSGGCGRPGTGSLLWVTVPREESGGETEASIPSSELNQQGRGDGYRGDARPEGRSLCEPGCRHRTLKEESFPEIGQSTLQFSGSIETASPTCQGLASDLDRGQPS